MISSLFKKRLPRVETLFVRIVGIIALIVSTGDVFQIVERKLAHGQRLLTWRKHFDQSLVRFLQRGLIRGIADQQFLDDLTGLVAELFAETCS